MLRIRNTSFEPGTPEHARARKLRLAFREEERAEALELAPRRDARRRSRGSQPRRDARRRSRETDKERCAPAISRRCASGEMRAEAWKSANGEIWAECTLERRLGRLEINVP